MLNSYFIHTLVDVPVSCGLKHILYRKGRCSSSFQPLGGKQHSFLEMHAAKLDVRKEYENVQYRQWYTRKAVGLNMGNIIGTGVNKPLNSTP